MPRVKSTMPGVNCPRGMVLVFCFHPNAGTCNSDKAQWTIMRPANSISTRMRCRSVTAFQCTARKSAAAISGWISERKTNPDLVPSSRCSASALSTSFTVPTFALDSVRTPQLVRDGDNSLCVVLLESGSAHQTQCGNDHELASSTGILCDAGYAGACNFITDAQFWSLRIPRHKITGLLPRVTRFAGAKLDKDITAQRLLFSYLQGQLFDILLNSWPGARTLR